MSTKKSSTKKAAAKKAAPQKTPKARPEVDLALTVKSEYKLTDTEYYQWELDGQIYAALLGSPDCPPAFRKAFKNIFIDHLFTVVDPTHPAHIAAFFPLVMFCLQEDVPADACKTAEILVTLRETLARGLTEKILAQLDGKGLEPVVRL